MWTTLGERNDHDEQARGDCGKGRTDVFLCTEGGALDAPVLTAAA
jgi:hypothetical protein